MSGPELPVTIGTTHSDSTTDSTVKMHQQHHDAIHRILNKFDTSLGKASSEDVLAWNGSVYAPTSLTGSETNGSVRTPEQYGAIGDGTTNDQRAIVNMFSACVPGDTVVFAAGKIYAHNAAIIVSTPDLTINGYNSTLYATVPASAALFFDASADRCTLNGLRHKVNIGSASRGTGQDMTPFIQWSCSGVVFNDVISEFAQGAGIFLRDANDFQINRAVVLQSLADGIHMTGGCRNGVVRDAMTTYTGDDGVAVVSYADQPEICRNIRIIRPTVMSQTGGRGISVVGGQDVSIDHPRVHGSDSAAIYIASELAYRTYGVARVCVNGGDLRFSNLNPSVSHGAIFVSSNQAGKVVNDVRITGVNIADTRTTAPGTVRVVAGNGGTTTNVDIRNLTISGSAPETDYDQSGTVGIRRSNWLTRIEPWVRTLSADEVITSTTGNIPPGLLFFIDTAGTYVLHMTGAYAHSATTSGPRFGVTGRQMLATALGSSQQATSQSASHSALFGWAGGAGLGANPLAANITYRFELQATVTVTTAQGGGAGNLGFMVNASAGTLTLRAGTSVSVRRTA